MASNNASPSVSASQDEGSYTRVARGGRKPKTAPHPHRESSHQKENGGGFKQKGEKRRPNANGKGKSTEGSRTIAITKVFSKDLEQGEIGLKLKQHRVSSLKEVLASFGEIENFDNQVEQSAVVIVTFRTREAAEKAVATLRDKNEVENLMNQLRAKLDEQGISKSVCPNLMRYKYNFTTQREQKKGPKTAYPQPKQAQEQVQIKTVMANNQEVRPQTAPAKQQSTANYIKAATTTGSAPASKKKPTPSNTGVAESNERDPARMEYLTRETEIARLKEEQAFFARQQNAVRSELEAERVRVKDRDHRITTLAQDLERVNVEKHRLEQQLGAEQQWKRKGEESITKLEDELHHLQNQQQLVDSRLKTVAQKSNGTA